jgi:predicted nuclease of predicted toxin-antitoxin system
VRVLGLDQTDDRAIWQYAKDHGFVLVSQDSDMADIASLYGAPPKVILATLRQSTYSYYRGDFA